MEEQRSLQAHFDGMIWMSSLGSMVVLPHAVHQHWSWNAFGPKWEADNEPFSKGCSFMPFWKHKVVECHVFMTLPRKKLERPSFKITSANKALWPMRLKAINTSRCRVGSTIGLGAFHVFRWNLLCCLAFHRSCKGRKLLALEISTNFSLNTCHWLFTRDSSKSTRILYKQLLRTLLTLNPTTSWTTRTMPKRRRSSCDSWRPAWRRQPRWKGTKGKEGFGWRLLW